MVLQVLHTGVKTNDLYHHHPDQSGQGGISTYLLGLGTVHKCIPGVSSVCILLVLILDVLFIAVYTQRAKKPSCLL